MIVLIKNGTVYTGQKGKAGKRANVLIEDGRVKRISQDIIAVPPTAKVINAQGKWVMPGFIDSHTHYDAEVVASPGLKESARHGVTSIILGSCSVSTIFNDPEETSDCFTRVEAIPRDVMLPLMEERKSWSSPSEWKEYIEQQPLGINVASFIGHSDLRVKAMGLGRSVKENEKATKDERGEMDRLLNEALDAGFLGMSTMDNPWDKMDGDKYWSHMTPSFYSSWRERKNLLKTLRRRGAILQGAPNLVSRTSPINYMRASTGLLRKPLKTTMIAMMDLIADRNLFSIIASGVAMFNKVMRADFRMQSPPMPFTVYYDGVDSIMFEEFPSGEAMRHLAKSIDQRNELIRDQKFRDDFKKEIKKKYAPKVWHRDLGIAYILECPDKSLIGKNFIEIAESRGEHPVDTFLDMIIEYDKEIRWTTTIANDRVEEYHKLYNYKYNLISFSDAGAHLNNMAFYDFGIQMLRHVYASHQSGSPIMPIEDCIWRLSGEQADWFGLDCGYIREGAWADIVIMDPELLSTVTDDVEEAPIEEFNGYKRLVKRHGSVVSYVLVSGKVIYQKNDFVKGYGTEERYGRFLPYQQAS